MHVVGAAFFAEFVDFQLVTIGPAKVAECLIIE